MRDDTTGEGEAVTALRKVDKQKRVSIPALFMEVMDIQPGSNVRMELTPDGTLHISAFRRRGLANSKIHTAPDEPTF
jgi:antitoxin component of MazEF toxin-antitoxin module